jgi:phospholipid/cholesterol/gamma-HCH transport system permease protein
MSERPDIFVRLGRWSLIRLTLASDIIAMLGQALKNLLPSLRHGNAAIRKVLFKQIYFTGLEASGIIVTIAVILGAVIITQVVSLVGNNGSLTGKILVWVVLRELAPLLTAIIVIARSGTAIAAELGSMKINGEIDAIEMLGIPADRYLILPRILGVTISVVILTFYFVLSSCIASFLIASFGWHIPYQQFVQGIMLSLGSAEIIVLFSKSLIFGLFVSAICCCYGLSVGRSATEIPQAATKAVMTSLFAVFFLDGLITYLASLSFSLVN